MPPLVIARGDGRLGVRGSRSLMPPLVHSSLTPPFGHLRSDRRRGRRWSCVASIWPPTSRAVTPPLVVSALIRPVRPRHLDAAVDGRELDLGARRHLHGVADFGRAAEHAARCAAILVSTRIARARDVFHDLDRARAPALAASSRRALALLHGDDVDLVAVGGLDLDPAVDVADLDPAARLERVGLVPLRRLLRTSGRR